MTWGEGKYLLCHLLEKKRENGALRGSQLLSGTQDNVYCQKELVLVPAIPYGECMDKRNLIITLF